MKSKTTRIWFGLAVLLLAFIWVQHKYLQPAGPSVKPLFPGLQADNITALQIIPAGAREINVVCTNGSWLLKKPLAYPAQSTAVEALAKALQKLVPATKLTAKEMNARKNADKEYGFQNPQFTISIQTSKTHWQLLVGNRTAPGDQVFVRVVGTEGASVVSANWLQLLPRSATPWRDTSLVSDNGSCDWLVITNATKVMEFRRNPTNQLWRMIRPLQARANSSRLNAALQQLRDGNVDQFVTDDSRADLSSYGLQPADLNIWLGSGKHYLASIHVGKTVPTNSAEVYVRRGGWNSVMTADQDIFSTWHGSVNDFRDPYLLSPIPAVAEIEVKGRHPFTLERNGTGGWKVADEKFPADSKNVQEFVKLLKNLRISEFVKDVATPADLQSFGLAKPARQITLLGKVGDTNDVLVKLLFGTAQTNRVFVKRADEDFVYAITPDDMSRFPQYGWEFRERHIWDFSETNITEVTLRQNGKTRRIIREGTDKWSLAAGSQGIINPPAIEETMHRLGSLTVAGWVGYDIKSPEHYGLAPDNLSVTVKLKSGKKLSVAFGTELPQAHTALAAVTLNGKRWAFVFPPILYQFVSTYLTIPANTP